MSGFVCAGIAFLLSYYLSSFRQIPIRRLRDTLGPLGGRVSRALRSHIHRSYPHLSHKCWNTEYGVLSFLGFLLWFRLCGCPTTTQASPRHTPTRQAPNPTSPHQRTSLTSVALARFTDAMTATITSRSIPQNKNGKSRREIKTEYWFD